ncbi:MAG TPA: hypothetical protein VGW12_05610 [Pyrinomonadaceae bacterium]|nr:hypothetical protein [Pyrinomonadaceae bacterium]
MRGTPGTTQFRLGSLEVPENLLKIDFQLTDRYQGFSAELVRLTLLGIAVFGFFYKGSAESISGDRLAKWLFSASVMMFACSAGAALFHRYFSTDSIACYIRYLRLQRRREDLNLIEKPPAQDSDGALARAHDWLQSTGLTADEMRPKLNGEILSERSEWHKALRYSERGLIISAVLLSVAALCLAAAFIRIIF